MLADVDAETGSPDPNVERAVSLLSQRYGMSVPAWRHSVLASMLDRLCNRGGASVDRSRLERGDDDAWDEVCTSLMVPETYFFRHTGHFRVLERELESRAQSGKPCRVLCAGCSTGEEVWSVAAVLATLPRPVSGSHQVVGWDASESRLCRARSGRYGAWSFRRGRLGYERWFRRDGDEWVVQDELRGLADFAALNLAFPPFPGGPFDVVLFRNVAIYFDATTVARVFEGLTGVLDEGGLILVGPHDPVVLPDDGWRLSFSTDGARIIRRRKGGGTSLPPQPGSVRLSDGDVCSRTKAAPGTVRPSRRDSSEPARSSMCDRRRSAPAAPAAYPKNRVGPVKAPAPPVVKVEEPGARCGDPLVQIESLADQGKYLMALEILRARVGSATLDEQRWEAILLLNLGRDEEAVSVLRRCVYLDPDDAVCRRWLEAAFRACGRSRRADREGRTAARLAAS